MEISLILAMAENGVIGRQGGLPWRLPEDMRRFKALTMGKPCIMGRKTWDSLPRKPLPGRTNIVVTRDARFQAEGAIIAHSLDEALEFARAQQPAEAMIIGGAEIYRAVLARATRVYLTQIHAAVEGDVVFSKFDAKDWRQIAREDHVTPEGLSYSYLTLGRDSTA